MAPRSLSFVIPVRNDAARLRRCLETIRHDRPRGPGVEIDVEIIVADNGSTDDSVGTARRAGATVLELPGIKVGALRNQAAAAARGDVLAFVDADNEIASGWIAAAMETLADDDACAVGAPYRAPMPGTWVQRLYDRLRRHPVAQERVEWLGSGNMAIRRSAFEEVGGFDVTLETCEDVDLCRKLRARGYVILADRRLENVHYGDPQTLRQVFLGELWRGRDNLKVSLRRPWSGRTLASAAIPVASLAALTLAVMGLVTATSAGTWLAGLAVASLLVLVALRAGLMLGSTWTPEWPKAIAVAAAYEAGRALALTGRFGYRRRRRAAA